MIHREKSLLQRIAGGSWLVSVLAILVSLIVGGILIAVTNEDFQEAATYFFARPGTALGAGWTAATEAYLALFQGAIVSPDSGFLPLTETLTNATPLIMAGLGVALAFRAGMFNIGAQGQITVGAIFGAYAGFAWHLPLGLHLLVVILMSVLGGALWGGIVGWLKATTGAHEVILTIMLNYVAIKLLDWILNTPAFLRPGETNPISPIVDKSADYPVIIPGTRLHLGFIVAILLVLLVWWILNRSTLGFTLRAVGENPAAAATAGMSVKRATFLAMAIAGGLGGFAASAQISGTEHVLANGAAGSIGFDAITVALLGRSTPWGTFFAGLLFGAFRAGATNMQISTGTPIDIVLVVQSLIVLFIAAPPLVRTMFGLNRLAKGPKPKAPKPTTHVAEVPAAPATVGAHAAKGAGTVPDAADAPTAVDSPSAVDAGPSTAKHAADPEPPTPPGEAGPTAPETTEGGSK
ncbi:ABC transporter permease [Galactobacter caseinivorans]|uniref:ABC transporter permease n=1 Tax=Galactobacter caseinivorans TaxID=2676123 RepID=A0A496PK37_9MICC|nr:ABC transporter permease [Galactobacter caseinivorans]